MYATVPSVVPDPWLAVQLDLADAVAVLPPATAGDQRDDRQQAHDHQGGGDHEDDFQPFH